MTPSVPPPLDPLPPPESSPRTRHSFTPTHLGNAVLMLEAPGAAHTYTAARRSGMTPAGPCGEAAAGMPLGACLPAVTQPSQAFAAPNSGLA